MVPAARKFNHLIKPWNVSLLSVHPLLMHWGWAKRWLTVWSDGIMEFTPILTSSNIFLKPIYMLFMCACVIIETESIQK